MDIVNVDIVNMDVVSVDIVNVDVVNVDVVNVDIVNVDVVNERLLEPVSCHLQHPICSYSLLFYWQKWKILSHASR